MELKFPQSLRWGACLVLVSVSIPLFVVYWELAVACLMVAVSLVLQGGYARPSYWHARGMQRALRAGDDAVQRGDVPAAERAYMAAVECAEALGTNRDRNTGMILARLGTLYRQVGRFAEAEPVLQRAFRHVEEVLLAHDPARVSVLNDLTVVMLNRGRHAEAEPLTRELLAIYRAPRSQDPNLVPVALHNLAISLKGQGKLEEAAATLAEARGLLAPGHAFTGWLLEDIADVHRRRGNLTEAEAAARESLAQQEQHFGPNHYTLARCLSTLGEIIRLQGNLEEAETHCQRCLTVMEKTLGPEHPELAAGLATLARVRAAQGKDTDAERMYRRCLSILEAVMVPEHSERIRCTEELAALLRKMGRETEAVELDTRIKATPAWAVERRGEGA